MGDFADFYREGGIWMHTVTLSGLVGLCLGGAQLALKQKLNLMPLLWSNLVGCVALGALGVVVGLIEGFSAIAAAPPDMKSALAAQAAAIAFNTLAWALMWTVPLLILNSLALTLRLNSRPAEGQQAMLKAS